MSDTIPMPRTDLQALFDLAVNSMDFGSGFFGTDEVVLLRRIALHLGVDPMKATPNEFHANYPHVSNQCSWRCRDRAAQHLSPEEYAEYVQSLIEEAS